MQIESMLTESLTLAKAPDASKKRVLETLANLLSKHMGLDDAGEVFHQFISREKLGSTGIGQGIAIPHCRFGSGDKTLCAYLTLSEPIDFDSVDNEPVDVVVAMLVPENAENDHLETLAVLAESLQKSDYVSRLRNAKNSHELYKVAIS